MEILTSTQAYEEYQRLRLQEERLWKSNRGMNLISKPQSSPFYISVKKEFEFNIKKDSSKIVVESNLPFWEGHYWRNDSDVESFLKKLESYCKIPKFKRLVEHNRRQENKLSSWNLPKFNSVMVKFEDIKIDIFENASKDKSTKGFKEKVKKILATQIESSSEDEKNFERYFFLMEKIDDLVRKVKESNYSGYCYGSSNSDTIKMSIDKDDYDKKLKDIEEEIKSLSKKYPFLYVPRFNYQSEDDDDYDEEDDDDEDDWEDEDDE